jgi:hypothetical protein
VTAQDWNEEQRARLDVLTAGDHLRRPSWLSAEDFDSLRAETGE